MPETPTLKSLLEARSVAIIGASADPLKIGGRPIEYLRRYGFSGRIVPVNPNRVEIQGLRCFRSLAETEPVDLAIVSAAATDAKEVVMQCLEAGTRNLILFTAGFAEVDSAGRAAQESLAKAAADRGAQLLGPNCLGAINAHSRLVASFTTALEQSPLPPGAFSYMGQSGALGAYWIEKTISAGLGVAKWITTGNEAQITLADALAYLANDDETRVIGAYIEDVKQPELFAEAAAAARAAGKALLAIKSGRSPAGQRAVSGHTGAAAGDDTRYQALLGDCGITRVASLTEMIDTARLVLGAAPPKRGKRLGVVTVSGGAGVLICDAAHDFGFTIPELPPDILARLDSLLPVFVQRQNPVDVTGAVVSNTPMLREIVSALAASDACDVIVLFFGAMNSIREGLVDSVRAAQSHGKPIVVIWMGASPDARRMIEAMGIAVFDDIPPAIGALARAVESTGRNGEPGYARCGNLRTGT